MKRKILGLFLSILFFAVFLPLTSVQAGVRIDKPKVRLTIPGGSYDGGEVKVENNGREPITVNVYLEDWVYSKPDGSKEFMPKGSIPLSCSDWITFYPAEFTLKPGGVQMVRYTVSVPKGISGGHYSVMFFETGGGDIEEVNDQGNAMTVKVYNRLGALFYVEPEGTIKKTAELKKISLNEKLNDFIVTADFVNSGNTDITASGTFNVIDKDGYVYARGEFDEVYTLPGDKATLNSAVQSTHLKTGKYDMVVTLDFQNGGTLVQEANFSVSPDGAISEVTLKK